MRHLWPVVLLVVCSACPKRTQTLIACAQQGDTCVCTPGSQMPPAPDAFCRGSTDALAVAPDPAEQPTGNEGVAMDPQPRNAADPAPAAPDLSKPGTFGQRQDPSWAKHVVNGKDLGWYIDHGPLTDEDCFRDLFVSVAVGEDVKTCQGVNYKNYCDRAKALGVAKAQAMICPGKCPTKTPIWDQFGKWDCTKAGAGMRAFCHWQVGFQCMAI